MARDGGDPRYDPDAVRQFYDRLGAAEWERLAANDGPRAPGNLVNLHLHLWHLRRHVAAGQHVLDVGAGPGRFTIELARMGARVTVGDVSEVQLELNRKKVEEAGVEASVVARSLMDVVDLSALPSNGFDAVVCFGGALSYVRERADQALEELLRVARPGAPVLMSVMSLLGTSRRFLLSLLELARDQGPQTVDDLLLRHESAGPLAESSSGPHEFRYYTWATLQALLGRHACEIVDASAANFLAIGNEALIPQLLTDDEEVGEPALRNAYLAWEVECCRQRGAIDAGTHIIAVVRKPE